MDREQLEKLNNRQYRTVERNPFKITTFAWSDDESDRTLLYGYDCERNTWHLYSYGGKVFLYVYNPMTVEARFLNEFTSYEAMVPDKRLYPERCDYEFCRWLIVDKQVRLPFLHWGDERVEKVAAAGPRYPHWPKYHGEVGILHIDVINDDTVDE